MDTDRLIDRLFPKDDRALVRSIRDQCFRGLREDQQIAAIHELATTTDMSPEDSSRWFGGFLEAIGASDVSQRFAGWLDQGAPGEWWASEPAPAEPQADPDGDDDGEDDEPQIIDVSALINRSLNPPPPPAPAGPTRAELEQRAANHLRDLSSPPGSEGWIRYHRGGGQGEYLDVLRALEAAPEGDAA